MSSHTIITSTIELCVMPDSSLENAPPLDGVLHLYPFLGEPLPGAAASLYTDYAAEYGPGNVLVIKRFPTGIDELEAAFADATDSVTRPDVTGLSAHSHRVLEEREDTARVLAPPEQSLLLETFATQYEWETPYLQRASDHESFSSDLGRFVAEATWQGGSIETEDEALAELEQFNRRFHEWLAANGLLDPGNVLSSAVEELQNPETRRRVQEEFDAVLVLEFEEFTAIDRAYLAWLTRDSPLRCVAERDSAIQRLWNEAGRIEDVVSGLRLVDHSEHGDRSHADAVASFLATGEEATPTEDGDVAVLESPTFEAQIRRIADEIELRRREDDIGYDDVAVVLQDSNAPLPETLRLLQNAGIPVTSATVGGLEHDPAARELYALVCWCSSGDDSDTGWSTHRAESVLTARTNDRVSAPDLGEEVREYRSDQGLADALWRWSLETDLKKRIAGGESPIEARTQFDHVREVLSLASFIDDSELLDGSWETLRSGLEREMERAASDRIASELEVPTSGVLVDTVRVVKNTSRDVVFMVNVVDREYPAEPRFTSLFPTPHLEQLDAYPAFTTPSPTDVRGTFTTESELTTRPLKAYYAALSRRFLAVGARAASENLYFGTYREEVGGTESNLQPSRYLAAAEDRYGAFERISHDGIHSHGSAVEFALTCADRALDEIRRAGVIGDPVDIDSLRGEFATVQSLLEQDLPDEVSEAIRTRVDFADGVVHRE